MKMRRILSLILAALFVVTAFASCANDNDEPENTKDNTGVVTDAPEDKPVFEEADYNEEEFKFLIYGSNATDFIDEYIWSDSVTGGVIGDAVLDRNRLVEEKYNVKVTAEECAGPMGTATKRMQAGQCDFDVIYEWGIRSKAAALDGMLYDFRELPYNDFDRSYWLPSTIDDLTINGKMFVATNYITMNGFSWVGMIYFNKALIDELQMTMPYEYVYDNNWTFDTFIPMVIDAQADLDGSQSMDANDRFGIFGDEDSFMQQLVEWSGQQRTVKNSDGGYVPSINTEKAQNIFDTWKKKITVEDTFMDLEMAWGANDIGAFTSGYVASRFYAFGESHCLFLNGSMDMTKEFINMKDDYGVAPNPKQNSAQAEYYGWVDACAPMFSIPIQIKDEDRVSIILEYMAYESENILLPAYYDTTIKTKRMQEVKDYDMLDIIRDSVHYDWTDLYMWDGDISKVLPSMLTSGHFASVYKKYENVITKEIDDIIEGIDSISQ